MEAVSRYTKQHYEDVARILGSEFATQKPANLHGPIRNLIYDFADLFAADNPPTCRLQHHLDLAICHARPSDASATHEFEGGFNPEQFLAACGLEPEQRTVPKQVLEHYGLSKIDQDRRG